MTTPAGPAPMGDNKPPLDPPDELAKRLERDHAALADQVADLELERLSLPPRANTKEEAETLTNYVAKAKRLDGAIDKVRVEEKAPYLEGSRIIDGFAGDLRKPLTESIKTVTAQVDAWRKAEDARIQAERREKERQEREAADRARQEQEAAARAAREAQEAARREEERIRSAKNAEERAAAESAMREQNQLAAEARKVADDAGKAAAAADRIADASGKGSLAPLAKVTSEGVSAGGSKFLNHSIDDAEALLASLGPLGAFFGETAISQALGAVKQSDLDRGVTIPGVRYFQDTRTNIRQAR